MNVTQMTVIKKKFSRGVIAGKAKKNKAKLRKTVRRENKHNKYIRSIHILEKYKYDMKKIQRGGKKADLSSEEAITGVYTP